MLVIASSTSFDIWRGIQKQRPREDCQTCKDVQQPRRETVIASTGRCHGHSRASAVIWYSVADTRIPTIPATLPAFQNTPSSHPRD